MTTSDEQRYKRPPSSPFNWSAPVAYDPARKAAFHREARRQLKALARQLGWLDSSYDLRSNPAGIAVSGEITLHHDHIYISVSQCRPGADTGILIRSCKSRKDFVGSPNIFAPLALLDDVREFAARIHSFHPLAQGGGAA